LPCRQINQIMKLTTHPHLVPRLENEWSYTSRDNFTFTIQ